MESYRVQGVAVPVMMYGTAWKEERTAALTELALRQGFTAIDTANQRKHYVEAGVGDALRASGVERDRVFLQTKFTYARGQDQRLPYDPAADFETQVRQSFASSLEHLGTTHVDALILHGPWGNAAIGEPDRAVWRAFEALHAAGAVRLLGVSNISLAQLEALTRDATIKPALVQNRCYANTGWDRAVRTFCSDHGMLYEGFSLLTANAKELASPDVKRVAARLGVTSAEVVFAFARALGIIALTGTSDPTHMRLDLAAASLALTPGEVASIERVSA